ncbi:hypothetical protein CV685_05680 [Borreliella burgdorferi]|nr:hypothetical protein CV664_05300 [Borreliella burgdorferi]PRR10790.1 hypothetical protein CV660_05955 [Borreliella burgdorferi]PRR41551.1 hypothetical protein CV685_05680 [Borreliella burgdorferi]PRR63179.1 hypothetical protein CV635_05580 [Borreliella burgdorferi]PRR66689.1 hypothetical protein CV636_05565 [Borreliella burgdorferi]
MAASKEIIEKRTLQQTEPTDQEPVDNKNWEEVFDINKKTYDFINSFLTNAEFNIFATILNKPKQSPSKMLNNIAILELNLEETINYLDSKKDVLDKVNTLDLEKIKNSLE